MKARAVFQKEVSALENDPALLKQVAARVSELHNDHLQGMKSIPSPNGLYKITGHPPL